MSWATGSHADVPHDAAMVLGTHRNGIVQWLETPPSAPPAVVDVPLVTQQGSRLNCTHGNWDGTPTSYAFQWKLDGTDAGTDAATYAVQPEDVGKSATCVVTATNALGSTAAPPSNTHTIT